MSTIFAITDSPQDILTLHVEMSAATVIAFDVSCPEPGQYSEAVRDICNVAPHMMDLDVDLMEAYDDAFRTMPKAVDIVAVRAFLRKYKGRIPDTLAEEFDLKV